MHTANCQFHARRIALASSSKELHPMVNTLTNRPPPIILPPIYPSAALPSLFIRHFTSKVEKHIVSIASEHVTSTLVSGTTAATFSLFEKVSQLTLKECIISTTPKLCYLDPFQTHNKISRFNSPFSHLSIQLFSYISHISTMLQICSFHTHLEKRCLDHNDLNNYRPVSNQFYIAKIQQKLVLSHVSSYLNSHIHYNAFQSASRPGHSTEAALLIVVIGLLLIANKGNMCVLALPDFSSALDN